MNITFENTVPSASGAQPLTGPIRARGERDLYIPSSVSFGRSPLRQALHDVLTVLYWLFFAGAGAGAVAFVGFVLLFVDLH